MGAPKILSASFLYRIQCPNCGGRGVIFMCKDRFYVRSHGSNACGEVVEYDMIPALAELVENLMTKALESLKGGG